MAKMTGLGKGLGSLIPKKAPNNTISEENKDFLVDPKSDGVLQVPVNQVSVNPHQPRTVFDHESLEELIESIKVHGIIQPLIVTKEAGGYQLIAGERRLRSAKIAGLSTVPVIVREASEQEKMELALIENVQRKNLNPIETAIAYQRLIDEFSLTQEEVAEKLGVSRSKVGNTIRFLGLPEKVQTSLAEEAITEGHAKVIAGLGNEKEQLDFLGKILKYNFSVREAEKESKAFGGQKKKKKIRDPWLEEQEEKLRQKLNTKVLVESKGGEKGQVVIEYYSEEELMSIVRQIVE